MRFRAFDLFWRTVRRFGVRQPFKGRFYWEWQIGRRVFQYPACVDASQRGFSSFADPYWADGTIFERFT